MESSGELFKTNLDKAFSQISLNQSTLGDHMKYKQGFREEKLEGGIADSKSLDELAKKHKVDVKILTKQFNKGIKVEMEHTDNKQMAKEIAMDHISEDPKYYDKLSKMETKDIKGDQNDKEMVDGIIDIIKQIKDTSNRKEVAQNMIKKLKREKVDFDHVDFLKRCSFKQIKKSEPKEATTSGSIGGYSAPVFSETENTEFWEKSRSETPKLEESEVEKVEATGSGSSGGSSSSMFAKSDSKKDWGASKKTQMSGGEFVEKGEEQVEKVEAKEATTSGSVGGYESPAMWAKSTKKKDWGPSRKTQYKGGSFVKIKKKCMTFPYCNQGDIKNLKLSKNESVKEAIKNVASKFNINENVIITILEHEYQLKNKSNK